MAECKFMRQNDDEKYCTMFLAKCDSKELEFCCDDNCTVRDMAEENERLKEENVKLLFDKGTLLEFCNKLTQIIDKKKESENKLLQTLQEIKAVAEEGLQPICYKANCTTCKCYSKKISNDTLENIINNYFDEDGDFTDTEGDFFEVLQAFIDRERVACNKAQPISEKILDLITKAEEE